MKKILICILTVICAMSVSCNGLTGGSNSGEAYTVEFNTNGGAAVPSQKVSSLTKAPETSMQGQIFCGWFLDSELKNAVTYPMKVEKDTTLYAKWTRAAETLSFDDAAVQFSVDNDLSYKAEYDITPKEIDVQALAALGYCVKIDVTYEVYYEKSYNVPFDVGYLGAPDYDVSVLDMYDDGTEWKDRAAETEAKTETLSAVVNASDFSRLLRLKLSTHNLQNTVYFKNVSITYTCQKTA